MDTPVEYISSYVAERPDRRIGLAGVDPTDAVEAMDRTREAVSSGLAGIVVRPGACQFRPTDSRAMPVFELCAQHDMLVMVDEGDELALGAQLEFARPGLLDELCRDLPGLRLIIGHMATPLVDETIALLLRHRQVLADLAGLLRRPWTAYNALVKAMEHGVEGQILFGSDYPFLTPKAAIENLFSLNQMTTNTQMPGLPREALRAILERNVMTALGPRAEALRPPEPSPAAAAAGAPTEDSP